MQDLMRESDANNSHQVGGKLRIGRDQGLSQSSFR